MNKLQRFDVEFEVKGKKVKFSVYHDLPNVFGMSIQDALDNWVVRTDKYTARSFCRYVISKDPINFHCYTR